MFLSYIQGTCHKSNARCEKSLSPKSVSKNSQEPHTKRERDKVLGASNHDWNPYAFLRRTLRIATCGFFYISAIQGLLEDAGQSNFFTQRVLGKGYAKELHQIGYTRDENAIKDGCLVPGGFHQHRGRHAVYFTLVNPVNKNPDPTFVADKHLKSSHHTIYVVDREGAQKETFQVLPGSQRLRRLLRHDAQRMPRQVTRLRDEGETDTNTRVAVAPSPKSRNSDTSPGREIRVTLVPWLSEQARCWKKPSASRRHKERNQCPQEH